MAQLLGHLFWPANFPWPMPDLWPTQPSIPPLRNPCWTMDMDYRVETIKWQTRAMYGCRPKSVSVGLGCSYGGSKCVSRHCCSCTGHRVVLYKCCDFVFTHVRHLCCVCRLIVCTRRVSSHFCWLTASATLHRTSLRSRSSLWSRLSATRSPTAPSALLSSPSR